MFKLPDLPYAHDALEPTVSRTTMETHHGKHHKKYVDTLNQLLAAEGSRPATLEEVVRASAKHAPNKLFNNAGQAWNHGFFWESMAPGGGKPDDGLSAAIEAFGGEAALKKAFTEEGVNHFASGWVWIVASGGALKVMSTHDADTALVRDGVTPVLVCDLWEHAYYLDYKQDRAGFLEKWWDTVANWSFASAQFAASQGQGQGYAYPPPTAEAA